MDTAAFITVDVFTSERFSGNPLAVFPDARGLSGADMQRIAREFNYSEVTFVLPPADPLNTARVRIFTPTMEVPFAGHPNVGTAYVLGRRAEIFGRAPGDRLRFEEAAGLVDVDLIRKDGEVTAATIRAPGALQIGDTILDDLIARAAMIAPANVRRTIHAPVFASVGLPFAIAELSDLATLARARPNAAVFAEAAADHDADFSLFLYARAPEDPWKIRARMFAPLDNVTEDPATGSASAALGALLVSLLPQPGARQEIVIEQGVEMGRRSLIRLDIRKAAGQVTDVFLTGESVVVMQGVITI